MRRDWAPYGADRLVDLVRRGYFTDVSLFRKNRWIVQFGPASMTDPWRFAFGVIDGTKESFMKQYESFRKQFESFKEQLEYVREHFEHILDYLWWPFSQRSHPPPTTACRGLRLAPAVPRRPPLLGPERRGVHGAVPFTVSWEWATEAPRGKTEGWRTTARVVARAR
jgi:hypothetical protein